MRALIIAEAGVNHEGDLTVAKKLAETALIVGADAVKFQTFWGIKCLKKYELTRDQWEYLKEYCDELGIEFMTTAHWGSPLCGYKTYDYDVIDFVDTLVDRHKVASPYLVNKDYLSYIAEKEKPLIVSTGSIKHKNGMATDKEIENALEVLKGSDITLMHCVSKYPASDGKYDRLRELRKFGLPVGLSDHTKKISIPSLPIIEKHIKLDDNCIDSDVSLSSLEFGEMVKFIRNYENLF